MATLAFFYEVLALLVSILAFVRLGRGLQGVPEPPEPGWSGRSEVPGVSVVLVVDREIDPEHAVAALLAQSYPRLDIVVMQCGARFGKRTAAQLEDDPRVRVIEVGEAPPGWIRRNYAFAKGAKQAQHELLLLLDGNVLLREAGLERAIGLAKRRGVDLLTIFPDLTARSWTERLMIPFFLHLTLCGVSLEEINDPEHEAAGGFAPFFLFRRTAYVAVGGHAAVRADAYADATLTERIKSSGHRLLVGDGTEVAVLQGQQTFAEIWRSWSRSFNAATGNNPKQALAVAALVAAVFALPWLLFGLAVVLTLTSTDSVATSGWTGVVLLGFANVMLSIVQRRVLRDRLSIDSSLAWLQPLAALAAAFMIFASSFHLEENRFVQSVGRAGARAAGHGRRQAASSSKGA